MRPFLLLVILTGIGLFSKVSGQPAGATKPVKKNVYSLIVGISAYTDKMLDTLHFADADARNFYSFLKNKFIRDIDPANVDSLINEGAKISDIVLAFYVWLDGLKLKLKPEDEIYIFWSGHGMVSSSDQKLICQDTKIANVDTTKLVWAMGLTDIKNKIRDIMKETGARVYLIVDACRSRSHEVSNDSAVIAALEKGGGPGEIDFYGSSNGGYAYETPKLTPGSGVFTYFLLLGLQGGADGNKNGKITLGELGDFLHKVVNLYVHTQLSDNPADSLFQEPDLSASIKANPDFELMNLPLSMVNIYKKKADSFLLALTTADGLRKAAAGAAGSKGVANKYHPVENVPVKEKIPFAGEMGFPGNDDSIPARFNALKAKINKKQLLEPAPYSAYDDYLRLQKDFPDSPLVLKSRNLLFAALLDKVKDLMENYLAGKLDNTSKEVFDLGYRELTTAIHLLPNDSLLEAFLQPKLLFLKARAWAGSTDPGDWAKGLALLDSSISQSKQSAYLYLTKGILNSNRGRYFTAKECFDSTILLAPKWTYALYNSAFNNYRLNEYGPSLDTCFSILRLDSGFSKVYSLIGLDYEAIADSDSRRGYGDAISWNKLALQKDSANTDAWSHLGRIYSKDMSNRAENIKLSDYYYRIGAERFRDVNCIAMLGKTCFDQGPAFYDSARYFYEKALRLNPFHVGALVFYATLLDVTGQTLQADSLFRMALHKSHGDYTIYARYCFFVFDTSTQRADSLFEKVIAANHEDPSIFELYSRLYESRDSLEKAEKILRQGMAYVPNSPSLNRAMARLYLKHAINGASGGYATLDSARVYLDSVNRQSPGNSQVNLNLYEIYSLENNDSAQLFLKKADSLNRYVHATRSFYKELAQWGDSAFANKKYGPALNYYTRAAAFRKDRFRLAMAIARCHYQLHAPDSALAYIKQADRYNHDDDEEASLKELNGLVLFDMRNYKAAIGQFRLADDLKESPDHLAEGLAQYKQYNLRHARSVIDGTKEELSAALKDIYSKAGTFYSYHFISEMNKLEEALRL